jgi:DNA-3-methyladenine glycosylase
MVRIQMPTQGLAMAAADDVPSGFFHRPAEVVAPELIGCLLLKSRPHGGPLWGVVVETEAYDQADPACHGHRRRSPSNDTLFGEPGQFYVYVSYGIHHCVNVVTDRDGWASGVLLRALALPGEPERVAAGPGLLARRFGMDRRHDGTSVQATAGGPWLGPRPEAFARALADRQLDLVVDRRIGVREEQPRPWRWYLRQSRAVSRRQPGERRPPLASGWRPDGLLPEWGRAAGPTSA